MARNFRNALIVGSLVGAILVSCGSDDSSAGEASGGSGSASGSGTHGMSGSGPAGSGASANGGSSGTTDGGQPAGSGGSLAHPNVTCDAFTPGTDLNVCTATYLASEGQDRAGGIDVAPDGRVVYGGELDPTADLGAAATDLLSGGSGVVVALSPDGRAVDGVARLPGRVADLAVSASDGKVAVAGTFGLAVLVPTIDALVFHEDVGEANRVAIGANGTVAVLAGMAVTVFDAGGQAQGQFNVMASTVSDLTVTDDGSVVVTGFKQEDGPPCTQLQIPFVRAYDHGGTVLWRAYDWTRTEVGAQSECADSRGIAVAMGRDGLLYFAGESHGGNTVFRRDPQDVTAMASGVVKTDKYTDPYNMNGAAPVAFYARLNPSSGALLAGQRLVTRLSSNDKGNAVRPTSIAADEAGNILLGGASACCIPDAAAQTISGSAAFGGYAGGGFVLIVSADLSERHTWTSFLGEAGEGLEIVGVAAGGGRMAVAATQALDDGTTADHPLVTVDALQSSPGGGASDGYFAVWRGPE